MKIRKLMSTVYGMLMSSFLALVLVPTHVFSDETCMSPYMAKIVGQEDYVYVWTLGQVGVGDEQDKLVTVAVNPASPHYGNVIGHTSVGGRNEAHHSGFTDDRHYLWAATLDTGKIFIFDVHTNPSKPKLHKVITDFTKASGGIVGPHTTYALPGRMMISGLSNNQDFGGRTALVEYTNDGTYVATYDMPTDGNLNGAVKTGQFGDGYGYDIRALPRRNVMITSSFTGWNNYMMNLGKLMGDADAMGRFGNTVVVWDLHTRKPKKVFDVPGAPLEIRCAWGSSNNYCFTTTALTSQIWLIYEKDNEWHAESVGTIGDPSKIPLPVDISITADDKHLWVNTWNDGMTRIFDISNPHNAVEVKAHKIGDQVNMLSQSWDGNRIYFTTSLLSNWDKGDVPDVEGPPQFFKAYDQKDNDLIHKFTIDFAAEKLGMPHQMRFGAYSLYSKTADNKNLAELNR